MIPRIIHYCWLSKDPIPEPLQKCMDSWKANLSDYEFVHWNFERFPRGTSKWVDEAFEHKKYAFAADYIRLFALYNYGGIYLDTDVEVVKDFAPFLSLNTMMCWQNQQAGLEVAAFGVEKHSRWVKDCLDYYNGRKFVKEDGTFNMKPLPTVIESFLKDNKFVLRDVRSVDEAKEVESCMEIPVFPCTFFSPKSYKNGEMLTSKNTYSIHHFAGSWLKHSPIQTFERSFWKKIGVRNPNLYGKIKFRIIKPICNFFRGHN